MSKPAKSRTRTQLNRAQLKAYEARRAEEVQRSRAIDPDVDAVSGQPVAAQAAVAPRRRIYALSNEQEMAIIRSDLKRLLAIVAVLLVVLAIATLVLR